MTERRWADEMLPEEPTWVRDLIHEELERREVQIAQVQSDLAAAVGRERRLRELLRTLTEDRATHTEQGVRWVRLYPDDEQRIDAELKLPAA